MDDCDNKRSQALISISLRWCRCCMKRGRPFGLPLPPTLHTVITNCAGLFLPSGKKSQILILNYLTHSITDYVCIIIDDKR
eukprot:scaffold1447_cov165-Ochromonas_danica.AAC.12